MKLRNQIINYYVVSPSTPSELPRVVRSTVSMPSSTARAIIERQFRDNKQPPLPYGPVLHVCYDYDSGIIYLPNSDDFVKKQVDYLVKAAKIRISQDFGEYSSKPPIESSPFTSLRIRSINSFLHARKIISQHYRGKIFKDLPVIEAYLDRMPNTLRSLPAQFQNPKLKGDYIGTKDAEVVTFVDEIDISGHKRKEPKLLLTQKPPFILINTSVSRNPKKKRDEVTASEKEWVVLNAYRDYLGDIDASQEEKYIEDDINKFADLYAIKRRLYLGTPFEQVCMVMMRGVTDFSSLLKAIEGLLTASDSLEVEGYMNPASIPYYLTFKIDDTFPIDLSSVADPQTGEIDTTNQSQGFVIVDYDEKNQHILIETPVFLSPEICVKILKAKSPPFICRYNHVVNKIDVKTDDRSLKAIQNNRIQMAKINGLIKTLLPEEKRKTLDFRSGELASGESAFNSNIWTIRKISDYLYASDYIKRMCSKVGLPFADFDVVVGPIAKVFGSGMQGGFMDEKSFKASKMSIPYELEKGVWISPPIMLINVVEKPDPAVQTETIIHEYRHYLYGLQNPNYENKYNKVKRKHDGKDYEFWWHYFSDPNEIAAHKENIEFELGLGKSYDEIIRNKVGGVITPDNYPIARKYGEMVQEVVKEIEERKEENEQPIEQH